MVDPLITTYLIFVQQFSIKQIAVSESNVKETDYPSLWKTFVISTISAICAYYIVFFFSNYTVIFFAYDFDIHASFSLNGISFPNEITNHSWSRDAMITILLSKSISSFFIGIIFLFILMSRTKKIASVILLLFWLNLFAFSSAFGELIDDMISQTGTYEVVNAMNINAIYLIIIAIILAFIFYKFGMMNSKLIKQSFSYQNLISIQPRIIFFVTILLIPWLTIVVLSCLLRDTSFSLSLILNNFPVIILLIPFLTLIKPENLNYKNESTNRFSITDLILVTIFIISSIVLIFLMRNGIVISG